jgi:hypothetical protein
MRHWFKGSKGHNTVTIDGLDQTPYRHSSPKQATSLAHILRRRSLRNFDAVEAEVRSPQHEVVHTRRVLFPHRDYWVIHDHVVGDTDHCYEARWHLPTDAHGRISITHDADQTTVRTPSAVLVVPRSLAVEIEPGWVSLAYGIKDPAPVVVVRAHGTEADIVTVVSPGDSVVALDDQTVHGALRCSVTRGDTTDLLEWTAGTDVSWERWSACP